ncbi:hypothetical protein GW933_03000 [Candidatus Falkowbacteria bacterium]|uniref:MAM domain-containing protein n=1 Tax=Candidatus Buchananbacteria bacterium CG10_big_fil_rev_8_21_14_0_10_33_19 TaxID=1974525 RepID=A0A2H0W4P4_9BACT|nr:hypothetical protein [Candidatus Falkowbacteria bacterium]PIS06274.1 MAG: hypothetical protein COT80_01755 [Candidatus Buchananbacteria bacterium CG10_big_fil_rev_8_21_14_0_10_33_19]
MKEFRFKILFLIVPIFLFFGHINYSNATGPAATALLLNAAAEASAGSGAAISAAEACTNAATAALASNSCEFVNGTGTCAPAIVAQIQSTITLYNCQNILITKTGSIQIAADDLRDIEKQTWKDTLAGAWKSMLSVFSKQLAYDTASWIASGGKGQKPLFITEGIGAYLKNTADNAAGTFIDEIDKEFGVNLCRPNFNVELMIKTSLRGYQPAKPSCNFTGMVNNWRSAINDASFSVEYSNYLKASENDIGIYLKTSSSLMDKVKKETGVSALEASINNGYKDLKSLTGWILTPGTMIRDQQREALSRAGKQDTVFTGTVWDFVETFLNSLVGQLLQNLKDGYFTSGNSNGNNFNLPDLSRFASLLNPESSPYVEGSIGAEARFLNLIESEITVGGPYNILNKLTACTEANKINPGPTDCVIDPILSKLIREKTLIKDLPESILNRQFVPALSTVNPQESFSLRNIVILRKYRIVPVGWEIAARYISNAHDEHKSYTLGDLVKSFNNDGSVFENLIDPQWVLKAPELFCRREGYGAHNDRASSQDGSVKRTQYCADEQQCVSEDENGNCTAYGYCTEERKVWNLNAPKCEPRFNTCQTFQSQNGSTGSYLSNTLDYRDCDAQSAGCRWYSTFYNTVDGTWLNTDSEQILKTCTNPSGCVVSGLVVDQWDQTATSINKGVVMAQVCTLANGCDFSSESCTIPDGGVECSLDKCLGSVNILTPFNSGFELTGGASYDARFWVESYQNDNNRQFRSNTSKRTGSYSLESLSFNNPNPLQTTLEFDSGVEANKKYQLSFYLRGSVSVGSFDIKVLSSTLELGNKSIGNPNENWQKYDLEFNTQNIQAGDKIEIRIITNTGTVGTVFFDDFDLREAPESCSTGDVALNLGSKDQANSEIYFDRDVQTCDASAGGCSQFIRVKAGLGSNLINDGSFENYFGDLSHWSAEGGNHTSCEIFAVNSGIDGSKAIGLRADFTAPNNFCAYIGANSNSLSPLTLINGQKYVLSARVYTQEIGRYYIRLRGQTINTTPEYFKEADLYKWTTISTSFVWNKADEIVIPKLTIEQGGGTGKKEVYFDAVKLEEVLPEVVLPSAYTSYDPSQRPDYQLAYLKKAPAYYNCYDSDLVTPGIQWPTGLTSLQQVIINRNPACSSYSSVCIKDEMNCELYTPTNGDPAVPGTITSADVCPAECVGYQVYKQEPTSFVSSKYKQFINNDPIQACSAAAVGCDEFTNLDEIDRGGEALEYYTQLRTCQKPDAYDDEATYYTWEGSDTTGYQLRVFELKESNNSSAPCTNISYPNNLAGENVCSDPAPSSDPDVNYAACLASDLNSNPDCREFYDIDGTIHYRLLSRVIYVDNSCHPYRRTQTQNDDSEAAQDCRNNQGYWNSFNECIYMAIPNQGGTCSANLKGCREYTGNQGNSFKNIFLSDFESGISSWQGGTVVGEATHPGGNSISNAINDSKQFTKTVLVQRGKNYSISFWAKADENISLSSVRFSEAPAESSFMIGHPDVITTADIPVPLTINWNRYELGPVTIDWGNNTGNFEQNIEINIPSGKTVYIDNILLKELPQSVYAIENSWFTPFTCDNNLNDPYGTGDALNPIRSNPGKMIGCQEYRDRSGQNWFLKSFENLCRSDAVGCEQLIDTYNSNSYFGDTFNDGDKSEVTVPNDNYVYMVNDPKFACGSDSKGCSALGLPTINNQDEVIGYNTVYLKNQPDRYATDLCQANALWCEEFVGSRSVSYFKNPRDKLCEYRTDAGQIQAKWYKKGTNQPCDVTYLQTIGTGSSDQKLQPVGWFNSYGLPSQNEWPNENPGPAITYQNWVGSCPTDQNSCTEYIDPSTEVYKNEILNADTSQDVDEDTVPDHWNDGGTNWYQTISLSAHTLYSLAVDESLTNKSYITIDPSCNGIIVSPDLSLNVGGASVVASPKSATGRFYIVDNSGLPCSVNVNLPTKDVVDAKLSLVQAGVYYALSNKVDYTSCNGLVDYNSGCVLFNDRGSINPSSDNVKVRNADYLSFDADASYRKQLADNDQKPIPPEFVTAPDTGDSNVILKVQPDRACYNWLYCTTYEKDDPDNVDPIYGNNDRCLNLGLCASVDENGVCTNFILKSNLVTNEEYTLKDVNKTGYTSVGYKFLDNQKVTGYYPYYEMFQHGDSADVTNGSFESVVGSSAEPIGWSPVSPGLDTATYKSETSGWQDYEFVVAKDVIGSPDGSRYLIVNSFYEALSEEIDVFSDSTYILSGWINSAGLNYSDKSKIIKSQIQYRQHNKNGGWGNWEIKSELSLDSGLPWTKKIYEFTSLPNTDKIQIKLKNYINLSNLSNPASACANANNKSSCNVCDDNNKLTPCELGGVALFDDISLKPVLEVSDSTVPTEKYVSRTCRIYPAEDSLSCRYLEGNNLFYGNYGYCLLVDPANSKQCLQWWPVDQLEGEVLNEVGGYNDRVPLDYCVDKKSFNVSFSEFGYALTLSSDAKEVVAGFVDTNTGTQMNFSSFKIKDDFRPLFRYPYVKEIKTRVSGIGYTKDNTIYAMIPVNLTFKYDTTKKEWGSWGAIPVCGKLIDAGDFGVAVCFAVELNWDDATKNYGEVIAGLTATYNSKFSNGTLAFGPLMGLKIIDDSQSDSITGSGVSDPIPDLPGDILGAAWFVRSTAEADVIGITMNVSGNFDVGYCDNLVRVVNTSGENKAYANRVAKGSGYINIDRNAKPDAPLSEWIDGVDLIDGSYYYYDPFDYNKFLDAATQNKEYQSSDYQPFGALVSPPGSSNPSNWSSREGIYNTPLLYEPPRLGGFQAPYQARMGELHTQKGLEQLFAQSYGEWWWRWNVCGDTAAQTPTSPCQTPDTERGGSYIEREDLTTSYLTVPLNICNEATRDASSNQPCHINPLVKEIKINNVNSTEPVTPVINRGVGLAKLAFSTQIDPDQLPITAYTIKWGDGEHSKVSGVSLRNRTNIENPFLLYHLFDFWKVKSVTPTTCNAGATNIPCCTKDSCKIKVDIKVYDNWNYYNTSEDSIRLDVNKN